MRIYHKTAMKLWYYRNHRGSTRKNSYTTPSTNRTGYYESITNQTFKPASSVQPTVSVNKSNSSDITLEPFDLMTGVQFKDLMEKHFIKNGYSVNRISPRINNIDFLIKKDNVVTAVATRLTFDLIQKSYVNKVIESSKAYDNISNIMIITNSHYFMPQAEQLANEYGIILWDREKLKSHIGGSK